MRRLSMRRIASVFSALVITVCFLGFMLSASGCGVGGKAEPPKSEPTRTESPRVVVKRVPCRMKIGPLVATLEVDLSELKNLVLDAKQLYSEIVHGEP